MAEKEWIIKGYQFFTYQEYEKAAKELETVTYIKAKLNLNDMNQVLKVYNGMIEKNMFYTMIGYEFLKQLRVLLVKNQVIDESILKPIPIQNIVTANTKEKKAEIAAEKYKTLYEGLQGKRDSSKIIIGILILMIGIMGAVTVYNNKNNTNYNEEKLIDKYESWQQQLEEKEQELEERETILNQNNQ